MVRKSKKSDDGMGLHVCILGNVIDGIGIFGPFKTRDDAIRWGEYQGDGDWYIAPLQAYEAVQAVPNGLLEQRIADRIDGYDRDDLGDSPDF